MYRLKVDNVVFWGNGTRVGDVVIFYAVYLNQFYVKSNIVQVRKSKGAWINGKLVKLVAGLELAKSIMDSLKSGSVQSKNNDGFVIVKVICEIPNLKYPPTRVNCSRLD